MWSKGVAGCRQGVSVTQASKATQRRTIRTYGGLKDEDRIFTNLYLDGSPFLDGALKRVSSQRCSEHLTKCLLG